MKKILMITFYMLVVSTCAFVCGYATKSLLTSTNLKVNQNAAQLPPTIDSPFTSGVYTTVCADENSELYVDYSGNVINKGSSITKGKNAANANDFNSWVYTDAVFVFDCNHVLLDKKYNATTGGGWRHEAVLYTVSTKKFVPVGALFYVSENGKFAVIINDDACGESYCTAFGFLQPNGTVSYTKELRIDGTTYDIPMFDVGGIFIVPPALDNKGNFTMITTRQMTEAEGEIEDFSLPSVIINVKPTLQPTLVETLPEYSGLYLLHSDTTTQDLTLYGCTDQDETRISAAAGQFLRGEATNRCKKMKTVEL